MPLQHPLRTLTIRQLIFRLFQISSQIDLYSLHESVKAGDEKAVRVAIAAGVELDAVDDEGCTALQLAARSGCTEIFIILLEAGASPDVFIPPSSLADVCILSARLLDGGFGIHLFSWALSLLRVPIPGLLLRSRPFSTAVAYFGGVWLCYWCADQLLHRSHPAAFIHSTSIIEALSTFQGDTEKMATCFLDAGPMLTESELVQLWSHAVERGYTGICQRLLQMGHAVDTFYFQGDYPDIVTGLLHACGASHRDLVTLLLSHGANPNLVDNHGRSGVAMAVARPYTDHGGTEDQADEILGILLATEAVVHIDKVQKDLDPEVPDFNLAGREGWPLADAVQGRRVDALRMLLEAGADPEIKNKSGLTALHSACKWHVPQAVEMGRLLIQHGADVNASSDNAWTPLGYTAWLGKYMELVEALVWAGADLESTAGEDTTALQVAARHDISGGEIFRYLIEQGANVNATGGTYGSILLAILERPMIVFPRDEDGDPQHDHDAAELEMIRWISQLLDRGLDLERASMGPQCAAQVAATRNMPQVLAFLLGQGAELPFSEDLMDDEAIASLRSRRRRHANEPAPDVLQSPIIRRTSILSNVNTSSVGVLRVAIEHGLSLDVHMSFLNTHEGLTLLGAACSSADDDNVEAARLLLDAGADANFRDLEGHLPVQRAAYAVSPVHLQMLIDHKAVIDMGPGDEYGSLLHSLFKGLSRRSDNNLEPDDCDVPFLVCRRLFDARLPRGTVWTTDGSGMTCLHHVAETAEMTCLLANTDRTLSHKPSDAIPLLKEFLEHYGQPHPADRIPFPDIEAFRIPDNQGRLAFHILAQKGDTEAMRFLIDHVTSDEHNWDQEAKDEVVAAFFAQTDIRGWNALHFAASEGRIIACSVLLEAGVDATLLTADEKLAIDLAEDNRHYQVAEYITLFLASLAGDEEAKSKADSVLATACRSNMWYGFSQGQLDSAVEEHDRALTLGRAAVQQLREDPDDPSADNEKRPHVESPDL